METLDLEYTPIVEPLPALAAAAEVVSLRAFLAALTEENNQKAAEITALKAALLRPLGAIECPDCNDAGGEGVYCETCLCTGSLAVPDAVSLLVKELRMRAAALEAELKAWNTIPATELVAYWNAFGNDNDTIGDWINELRNGVNVGRYYAGLEPL